MEISAIYHDISKKYCFAIEKGKILFRIKTKKDDIKKIVLHYKDKYIPNVDAALIYQAMYELNTKVHQQLEEQILEDIKSGKIK